MVVKKVTDKNGKQDAFDIRNEVFVLEQKVAPELEWDEFDALDSTVMFVDYDEDGTALATGRFRALPAYGKVERICARKIARKKGSGRRIIEAIEQEARDQNVTLLKLGAQTTAIPFYEKLGYEVCSDIFLDAGIEHKDMEKQLN
ncbi:GNAT family acetyltransferase [Listeria weihenstephanensis FSL R9-0317]|uniref:GNAT family acetyltransferase n=1 Tax=Listeria weihenstephanensis TaxID=1006155 RepID=A0A1S7FT65_9LIST|nr:GNAT family N-acetyltransferase [Listeria weihenstephanensis]AQY50557.1 GNAT family acetyltransferase [Listeria weihenstephanensis]EUJ38922.1 GNAT family acetyltransferase [Listeria weihenstephanensis FSL R9-0317]